MRADPGGRDPARLAASESPPPFRDTWEHLAAELARLELLLDGAPSPTAELLPEHIAARVAASAAAGIELRLPLLARLFGLSPEEQEILLLCLAPVTEPAFARRYAQLNGSPDQTELTPQVAMPLLASDPGDRARTHALFSPTGRLFRAALIHRAEGAAAGNRLRTGLQIDQRIAGFLLGEGALTESVDVVAELAGVGYEPGDDGGLADRLAAVVREHLDSRNVRRLVVQLSGRPGTGRRTLALAVCSRLDTMLLLIDLQRLLGSGEPFEHTLRLAAREALLQPAALGLVGFDRLHAPADGQTDGHDLAVHVLLDATARVVADFGWLTFLVGERPFIPSGRWLEHEVLDVTPPAEHGAPREEAWRQALLEAGAELDAREVRDLARRFRLGAAQVRAVVRSARHLRRLNAEPGSEPTVSDVAAVCRERAGLALQGVTERIEPRRSWSDIVLPSATLTQLRELCATVRHRHQVYDDWGFARQRGGRPGVTALFSGASGTGKTMAAELVAGELGYDLYRIDLSAVVSKYIGETEKNLSRIFADAERGSGVLFFDEADALYGKRSEVKDAHDRYANLEISYLLQRIERFTGVAVLATNLKRNLDEAFLRRLQFDIEFPFPDATIRAEIWRAHFPDRAPRGEDIDIGFLAGLSLSGGSIANIVLNAAFLAAEAGLPIGMPQLARAARREYDKLGRLGAQSDLGPYWQLAADTDRLLTSPGVAG